MSEPDRTEQLGLPDLEAAPDGDDELENQSGLGRGLSSIIPQLAGLDGDEGGPRRQAGGLASLIPGADRAAPPAQGSDSGPDPGVDEGAVRQLRDDLIRALLDGLVQTMHLDLCAYVHRDDGAEPELFLRAPALASLGPQGAWAVFGVLRETVGRSDDGAGLDVAGLRGVLTRTTGGRSAGVFAVARADGLTQREQAVVGRFCSSFGRAVHQLVDDRPSEPQAGGGALAVELHEARDSVLARVRLQVDDREVPGSGRADTRVEAVTRAVLDTQTEESVFRYASEVSLGDEHAAVVLLESRSGAVSLGSAVTREGGSRATASAAVRALAGLVT